jgi:hypothetical protein
MTFVRGNETVPSCLLGSLVTAISLNPHYSTVVNDKPIVNWEG